jgi:hypothetical protein
VSTLDHKLEPEVTTVRRLEMITRVGRRRRFTEDFKARVVEETLAPDADEGLSKTWPAQKGVTAGQQDVLRHLLRAMPETAGVLSGLTSPAA